MEEGGVVTVNITMKTEREREEDLGGIDMYWGTG